MRDVTQILFAMEQGDPAAAELLLPLVYQELRRLAAVKLSQEKSGQTLQATALVHDAYIRLVDVEKAQHWNSRRHFFMAAAESMRRILVENARRKQQIRRGGKMQRIPVDAVEIVADGLSEDLQALDESLRRLEELDSDAASVVKLRYFAGMTMSQAAEALGVSLRTAERNWTYARSWLHRDMQ